METPPSNRGAFIAKLGAWLQLAPVGGAALGVWVIRSHFERTTTNEPQDDFTRSIEAMAAGWEYLADSIALSFIGMLLVTVSATLCRYRAKWLFVFLCYFGLFSIALSFCLWVFWTFWLPVHLAFGVFFLVFAITKKKEFQLAALAARRLPSCYKLDD